MSGRMIAPSRVAPQEYYRNVSLLSLHNSYEGQELFLFQKIFRWKYFETKSLPDGMRRRAQQQFVAKATALGASSTCGVLI
jgi:hypothetical protein